MSSRLSLRLKIKIVLFFFFFFFGPIRKSARLLYLDNLPHRQRSNADDLSGLDQVPEGKFLSRRRLDY